MHRFPVKQCTWACLLLAVISAAKADNDCQIRMSAQAPYGVAVATSVWNATLAQYLTEQLGDQLGCTFVFTPLPGVDAAYTVVQNNETDFLLTSSGLMHCLQVVSGIAPVASLVNWVGGEVTFTNGGCIYALANRTNITSLADLVDMKISLGPFTDLPAFEMQHIALTHDGVSILGQARQILFNHNNQQSILDLLSGVADIALGKADILSDMEVAGLITSMDLFKCITAGGGSGMVPGYPFPMTTSAWPEMALAAHPDVPQNIRKAVAEALFSITQDSYPAIAGDYSTWVPPYSYASIAQLEENVGYIVDGVCLRNTTLKQLLVCPEGQESLPANELANHCQKLNIDCPENHTCYCQPCQKQKSKHSHQYGLVGATAFILILALVPALVVIGCLSVVLFCFQRHNRNKQLLPAQLPFSQLELDAESEVLTQGTFGFILKGAYCGVEVGVMRLLPPSSSYKSIFGVTAKQHALHMTGPKAGKARRFSASKLKSSENSRPLLQSQGSVLARYSPSFIEQLRGAASTLETSRAAPKRRRSAVLAARDHLSLQRSLLQLKVFIEKRLPWGPAAAYRRRKFAVLVEVAERMHLRHPNLLTIMGVSAEPVTEDPLLVVMKSPVGPLKQILYNETVELEPEIVVGILKDVASALKYLHQQEPPCLDKELTTSGVVVDHDHTAQMLHIHISTFLQEQGGVNFERLRTPYWVAPEVLKHGPHSTASDVYAFGMMMYEVLFRQEPFPGETAEEVLHALCDKTRKIPKRPALHPPHGRPPPPTELVSLMQQCWHQDPDLRPMITEVKDKLLDYARVHFGSRSPNEAMALKHMKERALLDQILPPKVSAALREGRAVEPESFDCVTIFFSDIVGFQAMSATLPPQQVLSMLDRLYRAFDKLTAHHKLFKVETIGDSYMVVGNLRHPQPDHAAQVALFAIEAIHTAGSIAINEHDPSMGCLSIRAGFHSGPVVASVVGTTNPRYCLFGDTVNVASRMESSSIANRIHTTSVSADLIIKYAPELKRQLVYRGMQQVKGKGMMRTFWLELSQDHHLLRAAFGDLEGSSTPSEAGASLSTLRIPRQQSLGSSMTHLERGNPGERASAGLHGTEGHEHLTGVETSSMEAKDALIVNWSSKSFDR